MYIYKLMVPGPLWPPYSFTYNKACLKMFYLFHKVENVKN